MRTFQEIARSTVRLADQADDLQRKADAFIVSGVLAPPSGGIRAERVSRIE